jgi:trigger factor
MNVTIEDLSSCRKRLKIEVPSDRVNAMFDEVSSEFLKFAQIPGFRAGKAPKPMVLKRFSKDIDEETRKKLLPKAYYDAVEEKKLKVVSSPQFEDVRYQRGLTMSFTTTVDLAPEFSLPTYKGIEIKDEAVALTEKQVEDAIKSLVVMRSTFETIQGRPVQADDFAIITFSGTVDGQSIAEVAPTEKLLAGSEKFWMRINATEFVPGFTDQVIGMNVGDKKTITVDFAADFRAPELAGKKASYEVELHEIKAQQIPEMTDELAKELGQESAEKLRETVKSTLEEQEKQRIQAAQTNDIVKKLLDAVTFDLPESWVNDETQDVVYQIVSENQSRGIAQNVMEEKKQEIYENATKTAKERVKLSFIVQNIAEKESIKIEEQDMIAEIGRMAQAYRMPMEKVAKRVSDPQVYYSVRRQILTRKVLDFLRKEAKLV